MPGGVRVAMAPPRAKPRGARRGDRGDQIGGNFGEVLSSQQARERDLVVFVFAAIGFNTAHGAL